MRGVTCYYLSYLLGFQQELYSTKSSDILKNNVRARINSEISANAFLVNGNNNAYDWCIEWLKSFCWACILVGEHAHGLEYSQRFYKDILLSYLCIEMHKAVPSRKMRLPRKAKSSLYKVVPKSLQLTSNNRKYLS